MVDMIGRLRAWSAAENSVAKAATPAIEGEYRPGPYYLPVTHGWLPADVGNSINWWQLGYSPLQAGSRLAVIEACVGAYSQTVAMLPGDHWRGKGNGGRERVTTSSLARILRHPNDYQTISDLLLNTVRQLYLEGNAYLLCPRNARYEIQELHLMDNRFSKAMISGEGDIYYQLGGNIVVQNRFGATLSGVPARDVLHIKLHSDQNRNPLRGETPLTSAYLDVATGMSIRAQQAVFYQNQAKPGHVLATDLALDTEQVSALRDRWTEQTSGANVGGTPILTNGLKPQALPNVTFRDAQMAETLKLSDADIAMAFRVPPAILGIGQGPRETEALMQSWIASGLGFCLNHVEEAFGQAFELKGQPDEYVEFDTKALLRSAFKDRIEGLARAVQGGVFSPNEARNSEDLPSVEFGDEPRVQQQVVPLSQVGKTPAAPAAPPAPAQPTPPRLPPPDRSYLDGRRTALARSILNRSKQIEREYRRGLR